jgi:hypothetical protein
LKLEVAVEEVAAAVVAHIMAVKADIMAVMEGITTAAGTDTDMVVV